MMGDREDWEVHTKLGGTGVGRQTSRHLLIAYPGSSERKSSREVTFLTIRQRCRIVTSIPLPKCLHPSSASTLHRLILARTLTLPWVILITLSSKVGRNNIIQRPQFDSRNHLSATFSPTINLAIPSHPSHAITSLSDQIPPVCQPPVPSGSPPPRWLVPPTNRSPGSHLHDALFFSPACLAHLPPVTT
ncbi:hypothetical protein LIA77_10153 [Sarocladium implicatum]|nr:hypothetical protein LIA77_10153 [Sarocladium implicatum]